MLTIAFITGGKGGDVKIWRITISLDYCLIRTINGIEYFIVNAVIDKTVMMVGK